MPATRTRVATGIYQDRYSIRAVVNATHGRKEKRFKFGTDLRDIQRWRNETRTKLRFNDLRKRAIAKVPLLPHDLEGWCYLYVIAGDDAVKIGRTLNPVVRMRELQTGHDTKLQLLAAVPVHASLEALVHRHFAHLRRAGEWFQLTDEVAAFVAALQEGRNPVALLWSTHPGR